jgi:hypothetical protein
MGCSNSGSDGVQKIDFTVAELDALKSLKNIKGPSSSKGSGTQGLSISLSSAKLSSIGTQGSDTEFSLHVAKFHEDIHPFKYEEKAVSSNSGLKALRFHSESSVGQIYKYNAITAVDHNFPVSSDEMHGYTWYQSFIIDESSNKHSVYDSHLISYALGSDHKLHFESDTFHIVDEIKLSRFELGSSSERCKYYVSIESDFVSIAFSDCDLKVTAYDDTQTAYQFTGSLKNKSIKFKIDFSDFDIDSSEMVMTNALFNTSGQQVGYFNLNLNDGSFTILDNNKQPI